MRSSSAVTSWAVPKAAGAREYCLGFRSGFLLEVTQEGGFRNLEFNPAFERITGVPKELIVGKTIDEANPPEVAAIVNPKYRRCLEVGDLYEEEVELDLPVGKWRVYRFGHTTKGISVQPAQWEAAGFECDKISREAMTFHMDHVVGEIRKHLGDLIGTGITHVHFDSYEAGVPTWTPKMRDEFLKYRQYDLLPWLLTFSGRTVGSKERTETFKRDFEDTIMDLYRDVYFTVIRDKLHAAGLEFQNQKGGGFPSPRKKATTIIAPVSPK